MMTWISRDLCNRIPKHIKEIFYSRHQVDRETHIIGVATTFCVPRVLYQATSGSFKHGLKNSTKLQQLKKGCYRVNHR